MPRRQLEASHATFWAFMVQYEGEIILFESFWLGNPYTQTSYRHPLWTGIYNGWMLVLGLQILTASYSLAFVSDCARSFGFREKHPAWLMVLPLVTILVTVCQLFVQREIVYANADLMHSVLPGVGFWLASVSLMILFVVISTASQQSPFKKIPTTIKTWFRRMWPVIIVLFVGVFLVVEEFQFQSGVSKFMVVENREDFGEIYENPELWKRDLDRITSVTSFFRARVTSNRPKYAYCRLEVSVISYRILETILDCMGYVAGEPGFAEPLVELDCMRKCHLRNREN